jgi:putative DNA primase/helicase
LLHDVRDLLTGFNADRIPTLHLLDLLTQDPDMGWSSFNKGHPLTPRQLASNLKTYGIQPKTVRMSSFSTPKGYVIREFDDAKDTSSPLMLRSRDIEIDDAQSGHFGFPAVADMEELLLCTLLNQRMFFHGTPKF